MSRFSFSYPVHQSTDEEDNKHGLTNQKRYKHMGPREICKEEEKHSQKLSLE